VIDVPPIPEDGGAPRLGMRRSGWTKVCRCGGVIEKGSPCLEVLGLPSSLEVIFRGEVFCSPGCARAHFLEVLSVVEAIDTPEAEAQVTDLRELYVHLSSAYAKFLAAPADEWTRQPEQRPEQRSSR